MTASSDSFSQVTERKPLQLQSADGVTETAAIG